MKTKTKGILLALGTILLAIILFCVPHTEDIINTVILTITKSRNFLYIGNEETIYINEDITYVFTNYDDYYNITKSNKLRRKNFDNNNYVLIPIIYNPCGKIHITPTNYTIYGNDIDVTAKYYKTCNCGGCTNLYAYYLLKVDKSINYANVNVETEAINKNHCYCR